MIEYDTIHEWIESWLNGNKSWVIKQLNKLPSKEGMLAVGMFCNYLSLFLEHYEVKRELDFFVSSLRRNAEQ